MLERPSHTWQHRVDQQAAHVAAGTLTPDKAYAAELWPPAFITAVDTALTTYEDDIRALFTTTPNNPPDEQIWAAVERVVRTLNQSADHIETGEREQLADYVYAVLADQPGYDVAALATRRNLEPYALTDPWRDW